MSDPSSAYRRSVLAVLTFLAGSVLSVSRLSLEAGWLPRGAEATNVKDTRAADAKNTKAADAWVSRTLKSMSLDQKVGQLLVPSFESTYVSTNSDKFDELVRTISSLHVGGFHAFGGSEPAPPVLLNPTYRTVTLGQPLAAASLVNRLQDVSALPLLNTADFEAGVGFRIAGGTAFPRAMAFGAAGDERLAFEAGRITAIEGRALGIHVNFAPVADVNNNPRNPVINTRSFGEDPAMVGKLASAYVRGMEQGGMIATLKHFPGHGDTDVDTHLGLATIPHPRSRLDLVELPPFRAGITAGARAIMTSHIELPALDSQPGRPATFSPNIVTGLLRGELGFTGLIYTDSMSMHAVSKMMSPGEAAVRALQAGTDVLLHSPDAPAAFNAVKRAVEEGEVTQERLTRSVERILRAKAFAGLHRSRRVDLEAVPIRVGARSHAAVAREASQRSITLIKDERRQVPLRLSPNAAVLYLSVLDYPSGWGIAAPSRTFIPGLKARWPNVTAIELSDRSTSSEIDLVRTMATRYDAIIVAVFVRTASYSGRMDLSPPLVQLLGTLSRMTAANTSQPFVTVIFGNPYVATFLPELPAVLLTYDFYDHAEASAASALIGRTPISGRLPISLPGMFNAGFGLDRMAVTDGSSKAK